MNKTIGILLVLLLIISVLSITPAKISGSSPKAVSTTIYVNADGTADYISIQEAINNATEGDTIYVYSGTYKENVVINKRISLTGENRETTIIDGGGNEDVVRVSVNQVNVSNLTITNSGSGWVDAGIKVNSFYSTVTRCNIRNNDFGVYLSNSSNNQIINSTIYNNSDSGIYLEESLNNTIIGGDVYDNHDGISIHYSSNNNIMNYNCYNNSIFGIWLDDSSNNQIRNCNCYNNSFGIYIIRSSNNSIIRCASCNNSDYGVTLVGSSNNNQIICCNLIDSKGYGVYAGSTSTDNIIHHNNFVGNGQNACDDDTNIWDNGFGEGNYWNDYTGIDANDDGIGDSQYNISGGNSQDRFPLMSMVIGNVLPIVIINLPLDNAILNSTVNISGTALDADGDVQKVEIKIDNEEWEIVNGTATWNYLWDTAETNNGLHKISVRAWDGLNYSLTHSIDVYVENKKGKVEENGLNMNYYLIVVLGIIIGGLITCVLVLKRKKTPKPAPKKVIKIRCKKCGAIMEIEERERPLTVKCPKCGTKGVLE